MNKESLATSKTKTYFSTKVIARTGIVAALYMVATLAVEPLAFGAIQLRFSEVMVLLAFIDPLYSIGLIIGCAISNLYSPVGAVDVIFGTLGTVVAVIGVSKSKSLLMATIWPTLSMTIVTIGISLGAGIPYLPTLVTVMLGEFAVVTCIGYPIFKKILQDTKLVDILKINNLR